jgi:DNA invertase Pin-like site-specific DNA recombinase
MILCLRHYTLLWWFGMNRQILAITTCRVSTPEQLENNSLNRQAVAVIEAAKALGAIIPDDGQWSGSVSSKSGTNVKRKDLKEMLDYCKKHPLVKYLLVHEVDRFMRSVDELFYFEVLFREEVGVKVWYASQPELNTNDHNTKLLKAFEAFKGEGSNVERQSKSIGGQTAALKAGRYTFSPKPGYRKGYERGIQEIHSVRGPILKETLLKIVDKQLTPTQALIEFNKTEFFANGKANYKMDKFRKIVTDPFYAGILVMDKQVKVRNENGLHEPLISKEQHLELVRIMNDKKKTQSGPRKNGNPKYPMSNDVTCDLCIGKRYCRFVGFDHGNGKNRKLIYEKYRCRECARYLSRQQMHEQVEQLFKDNAMTLQGKIELLKALDIVWKQSEGQAEQTITRINHKIESITLSINQQVEAATNPDNAVIKADILSAITSKKNEISSLEEELTQLRNGRNDDKEQFLKFAFSFIDDIGSNYFSVTKESRKKCKQLVFPAGFFVNADEKVYTPEISILYRLAGNKKDLSETEKSFLVRDKRL